MTSVEGDSAAVSRFDIAMIYDAKLTLGPLLTSEAIPTQTSWKIKSLSIYVVNGSLRRFKQKTFSLAAQLPTSIRQFP